MSMAYNPKTITDLSVTYAVKTTGDRWFIPTTGKGDNPDSGTTADQKAQCENLSPFGEESVVS